MPMNKKPAAAVRLQDAKCRLRPLREEDQECTLAWRNDPELIDQVLGYRMPVTQVMERTWFTSALQDDHQRAFFGIEPAKKNLLVGLAYLSRIAWIDRTCWLSIVIGDPAWRGKGLGRSAVKLLMDYAFATLGMRKISLEVLASNEGAVALYLSLGFTVEGRLSQQVLRQGKLQDVLMMGAFASVPAARPARRAIRAR